MSIIGDRIKELRKNANLTQDEMAAKLETTKQTIYKYEAGIVTNVPSDKVEQMGAVFNVNPAYIMGWTDDPTPPHIETIAAHHDEEDWTDEELAEIEEFKKFVLSKRK